MHKGTVLLYFPCVYVQDGHGSVTALLNEDGTERKTYKYNPYGKEEDTIIYPMGSKTAIMLWRRQTEEPHNPFRYCGEYYDDETDLVYLRNRYYDNQTGRFIAEDPVKDEVHFRDVPVFTHFRVKRPPPNGSQRITGVSRGIISRI